ncbi:hypothetical protein Tco_0810673 [Tanacetum coccineum]
MVESLANTLSETVVNTPEIHHETETQVASHGPMVEVPTEENIDKAPAPLGEPQTIEVSVETETNAVVEQAKETIVHAPAPTEEPQTAGYKLPSWPI